MPNMTAGREKKSNAAGAGCLALFALPFAGVGVFMAWRLVSMLWLAAVSQAWVATPATLTHLELKGSDTHRVVAEYDYAFNDQPLHGNRVMVEESGDNFGSFQRNLYQRLKKARDANDTVVCYVNPSDPTQALLDRTLRPSMVVVHLLFAGAFGGAGFGIIGWAFTSSRSKRQRKKKLAESPDEPWRVRKDWAAGEVRSGGWAAVLVMGSFALFWNAISWTVTVGFLTGDQKVPVWAYLVLYGLPAIGVVLAGAAVYQLVKLLWYGRSIFRLATPTGVVGGELAGVVLVPESVHPEGPFRVTLACEQTRTTNRGGDSETTTVKLWEDSRSVDRTLHDPSGKRGVPVRFVIPSGEKPTDPDAARPIAWKLELEAETRGPNYHAEFDVPVFVTADSREGVVATGEALTEYEHVETLASALARCGLRCEERGDGSLRVEAPTGRNLWSMTVPMVAIGLLFLGVSIGMAVWNDEWIKYLFVPVFGLFCVALPASGVAVLLATSELDIERDRWQLKSGWYGFRGEDREFAAADVERITTKQTMSSTSGSNTTVWKNVEAKLTDGERVTLVRGVKDRAVERRLVEELKRLAGLQPERDTHAEATGGDWSSYDELDDAPLGPDED